MFTDTQMVDDKGGNLVLVEMNAEINVHSPIASYLYSYMYV